MHDTIVVQLSTMVTALFFVDSIGEIHMASIQLLSIIFRKYENLRVGIINKLVMSVHSIPSNKNPKNCCHLSNNKYIHNFTVLLLQLVQSVVVVRFSYFLNYVFKLSTKNLDACHQAQQQRRKGAPYRKG